jgi:hypothetical protein
MKSDEVKWNHVKWMELNEINWSRVNASQTSWIKRDQMKPIEPQWNRVKSNGIKWNQMKPNATNWNGTKSIQTQWNYSKHTWTYPKSIETNCAPPPLPLILISTFSWACRYLWWLLCLLLGKELINGLTSTSSFAYAFLLLRCPLTWRVGVGPWFIIIFRMSLCHAVQFAVCLVCT